MGWWVFFCFILCIVHGNNQHRNRSRLRFHDFFHQFTRKISNSHVNVAAMRWRKCSWLQSLYRPKWFIVLFCSYFLFDPSFFLFRLAQIYWRYANIVWSSHETNKQTKRRKKQRNTLRLEIQIGFFISLEHQCQKSLH